MRDRTIYLDLDGTVLDVFDRLYHLHLDVLLSMGLDAPTTMDDYVRLKRENTPELQIAGNAAVDDSVRTEFHNRRIARIEDEAYLRRDRLFPWSTAALETLRSKGPIVLVTARRRSQELFDQLRWLQIADGLDGVIQVHGGQQKAEAIVQSPALRAGQEAIVGDTEADIDAGRRLGIATFAVWSGLRSETRLRLAKPDHVAPNLMHVAEALW